jgi:hypothetical protein
MLALQLPSFKMSDVKEKCLMKFPPCSTKRETVVFVSSSSSQKNSLEHGKEYQVLIVVPCC